MLKLAFLIRDIGYGGAQRQVVTLAKALDKSLFDVTILSFYGGGYLEKELKDSNIKFINLEKRSRWDLFTFGWHLLQNLQQIQPHILHAYLTESNLLTLLLKPMFFSTKIIWGIRNSDIDFSKYDWLARLLFQGECFLSRFADLIIVNSQSGYDYHLKHGFPSSKMVVIPNGINTDIFKPDLAARRKLRLEWEILDSTILIGLVGRLDPMKDHANFLEAAALLSKNCQDIRFICVGSGTESYTQHLYQLTKHLGLSEKVIWLGNRSDMPAVYNAFDIATSSSACGEGFANVIGEAMACGIPCVVTDVGDSAWIVGDIGVVVAPQNPQALVQGWSSLIEGQLYKDSIAKLKHRSRIVGEFSCSKLVKNLELYLKNK